jgi:serine/threonine-protein kinase
MATVYLAHDVRHDRPVALKVLRPELSAILGAERFLAEIKTTANLQHPHILPLHDSGEAAGLVFYVMPYVEGESLRDRLRRDKQLPLDEALRIAREVADALDYAHRHGVIHRDIKPENILLHDGHVAVADFGIALAASRSDGGTRMTETGMSLGTPQYMSPEQAMGEREISPKADVYALGAVLYEMLVGEPPFSGPTAQAIVAKLLTTTPTRPSLARQTVPPHVEQAVLTALQKLPADRFASAAQFAAALAGTSTSTTLHQPPPTSTTFRTFRTSRTVPFAIAALAIALAAWGWLRGNGRAGGAEWRYITFGDSATPSPLGPALAISPDGSMLLVRDAIQNARLWVKRRGELQATPIASTERANNPVFSPDGEWIAFVADGRLRKIRPSGGSAITIADSAAGGFGGAAWLDDGTMLYVAPDLNELRRVDAQGGPYTVVLRADSLAGAGIGMPMPLPGSRGALFQACNSGCVTMGMHVLDLRTGTQRLLLADAASAWLLPGNRLLYVRRDGVALVAPFDLDKLEIAGPATPVLETVLVGFGYAQLAWSPSGALLYVRGTGVADNVPVRVARNGAITAIDTTWSGQFNSFALSPDGRRLAVGAGRSAGGLNIWIKQLDRGAFTRLTFGSQDRRPTWSPDGRLVAFIRDTANTGYVAVIPADGSGPARTLLRPDRQIQEVSWSRDGRWVLVRTDNGTAGAGDILAARAGEDTIGTPAAATSFTELHPALSPNSRWLAYASNESGTNEVYVRPFPGPGGRWQVSNGGGGQPVWSPDGRELFYLSLDGRLMAAQVRETPSFAVLELRALFDANAFVFDAFHQSFDVAPDGRSFVLLSPTRAAANPQTQLVEVENWFADVRTRLRQ